MDPAVAGNDPRETRILAAIVFTDVVGFSRMAAQNEARVYVALQRDLGVMTNLCRAHQGQVLNTMGDGMLLCFMSAVDAMACAIAIQKTLYHQAQTLPPTEVLQHRIGVHLGDVIMSGDNVFGDGVNVAARLQTVAKPGAIAFSSTVHDVIRNKLDLKNAVCLGNQQLKNLGQPLKVWQVPPIEDSRKQSLSDDLPVTPEAPQGATGFKGFAMILGGLVLLGGVIGAFSMIKVPPTLPARANGKPVKDGTPVEPAPEGRSNGNEGTTTVDANQLKTEVEQLRPRFQFEEIVSLINKAGKSAAPEETGKLSQYVAMASLMSYLDSQVARATPSAPLRFQGVWNGQPTELSLSLIGTTMQVSANGQMVPCTWADLGAQNVSAAARTLTEYQLHHVDRAPAEAPTWLETFDSNFGIAPSEGG